MSHLSLPPCNDVNSLKLAYANLTMAPNRSSDSEDDYKRYDRLEWIHLNEAMTAHLPKEEGLREKLVRKTKENPFVPLGVLATTGALGYGLWCMRSGQSQRSQSMMRLRVVAQGLTVAAIVVGMAIGASNVKN